MESETLNEMLQSIEDFIFIEEKIVTCTWLCQTLKIHVNTAKQLLYSFLQKEGVKDKVSVTYIIVGELRDGKGLQLKLVDGKERENAASLFSKLTTDHIYSVQKSTSTVNPLDIYNAFPNFRIDPDERQFCAVKPAKTIEKREIKLFFSSTKNPNVPEKQAKPVEKSKEVVQKENQKPPEKNECKNGTVNMFGKQTEKKKVTDAVPNNTSSKVAKKPGSLSGFFDKQPKAKKKPVDEEMVVDNEEDPPIKETETKADPKDKAEKKTGGLSGFFNKQPKIKKVPVQEENMEVDSEEASPNKETSSKAVAKEKVSVETKEERKNGTDSEKTPTNAKDKKPKGKENRKKRKKRDEKDEEPQKKRKRIATVFSSDSSSSENEQSENEPEPEQECPPPPQSLNDEEDIIPPTPTPGRKRVRKQIDKTYTDEDGFILTKKEFVYESCTDDEVEEVAKGKSGNGEHSKNNLDGKTSHEKEEKSNSNSKSKKSPVKKQSPGNVKPKQSAITSFFKKK